MRGIVIAVTLTSLAIGEISVASELTPIMPEEVIAYAAQNGCEQVNDFFKNRPGMVNPPYAYGYLPGLEEESAALWCQAGQGDNRKFYLLIMMKKPTPELARCPAKIEWQNYPGGLSIYKDRRTTLKEFVFLTDPKRKGPRNVRLSHNGILSEYDGVTELFYCYKGAWLIRMRD